MTIKPYSTGSGIMLNDFRFPPGVAARIEALGKLNDRRLVCAHNLDLDGLREIAARAAELDRERA